MIRDEGLDTLDPAAAALVRSVMAEQSRLTQELSRLGAIVQALSGKQHLMPEVGTHKCPGWGCARWVTPVDGRWPGHEIAAGPSGRRNGPYCRLSGQPVPMVEAVTV